MYRVIRVGAAVAAMIVLGACEEPGKTVRVPATTTSAAATTTTSPEQARLTGELAEGMRIAEVLALPTDIDPSFVRHSSSDVLTSARLLVVAGHHKGIADVADEHGLLAGFVSQRSNGSAELDDREWLTHGVMRFPDADTATTAADDFALAATTERGMLQTADRTAASLPSAPETRYVQLDDRDRDRFEVMAFTPHGDYVVFTMVGGRTLPDLDAIVVRALEQQEPLLDSFTPTPETELSALPYDPDGIFELSVGEQGSGRGAYRRHAAVLFAEDQQAAVTLYAEVGLSAMAVKGSTVYRTAGADSARELATALTAAIAAAWDKTATPAPADVPGAACLTDGEEYANSWVCLVSSGRHVGEVWAKTQDEAHAGAREQHRVLAAAT
ncbi:hypothetical protein ACFVVM_11050 [Nocardia sp. NPDC058176]|uniref:DUF7373 family lipoprotein n=1 Tax=Nocardia sp. NPDC058176 TaxID=3346368 RepID=UPI0036D842C4